MEATLECHVRRATNPEHLKVRGLPHQNDGCCGPWTRHESQYILPEIRRLRIMFRRLLVILGVGLFALPCRAEVVKIEVKSRADLLPGKSFGSAGEYEKLSGKIYFGVDPRNSANRIVADIDKASTNAAGKVEFSSDFYMIKPKDISRGNGTVLYEVSNRGNKGMLGFFDLAAASLDPQTDRDLGDGFLMEQGFTLLWVGWPSAPPSRVGTLGL